MLDDRAIVDFGCCRFAGGELVSGVDTVKACVVCTNNTPEY